MSTITDDRLPAHLEILVDQIAARAARQAVDDAFRGLGLDIRDPAALKAWHADQAWTRGAREGVNRMSLSVKTTVLVV